MDKIDLRYAAGMFDADGSVTISKRVEQRVLGEYRRYQVRASLLSISPTVPNLFTERFRGKTYYDDKKTLKNPSWRPSYTWITVSRDASNFLRLIHPHLINKKEEAELALALEDSIQTHKFNLRKLPERQAVLDYREFLRTQISALKKRSYPILSPAPKIS